MTWYARRHHSAHSKKHSGGSNNAGNKTDRQTQTHDEQAEHPCKISDEFARRLADLAPNETVRAVVMPAPYLQKGSSDRPTRRLKESERQAMLREARQHTEASFHEIDTVLARTGGQRLSTGGNAFGYILIETNAAGIDAVSALDWVNVVMEDQPIHPQREPGSPDRSPRRPDDPA